MIEKLSFESFDSALKQRPIKLEDLDKYLEFDHDALMPKFRFRDNVLTDAPPPGYDVDLEVWKLDRALDMEEDERRATDGVVARKQVVAEGDSWYNLPGVICNRHAIADQIKNNGRYSLSNIAYWGHTLRSILGQEEQWLAEIETSRPDFFILCGGGNDLRLGICKKLILHPYEPGKPANEYITDAGRDELALIENGIFEIINKVRRNGFSGHIVVHGYDYPRPDAADGKYIGKCMRALGFETTDQMLPVLIYGMNELNRHIKNVAERSPTTHYVNLLCATKGHSWFDDMHPGNEGFLACAAIFEDCFSKLSSA